MKSSCLHICQPIFNLFPRVYFLNCAVTSTTKLIVLFCLFSKRNLGCISSWDKFNSKCFIYCHVWADVEYKDARIKQPLLCVCPLQAMIKQTTTFNKSCMFVCFMTGTFLFQIGFLDFKMEAI